MPEPCRNCGRATRKIESPRERDGTIMDARLEAIAQVQDYEHLCIDCVAPLIVSNILTGEGGRLLATLDQLADWGYNTALVQYVPHVV